MQKGRDMRRATKNIWLDTFIARKSTPKVPPQDLSGKTVVFTGGTDGMGRIGVERFAEMGANIFLFGRSQGKTERVAGEIKAKFPAAQITTVMCDLSDLNNVRSAAQEVLEQCDSIHYLINCAGINANERKLTVDGFEVNFAVNYLGPFLLTELLLERLVATPSSRIIQLASATQHVAKLNFDDLQLEENWSLLKAYAQAKLYLIMHTRDLGKRLQGTSCTINTLNPGYIKSNLTRDAKGVAVLFMALFGRLAAPTWVGGERILAAALSKDFAAQSGSFIYEDEIISPNPLALNDASVEKLMKITRDMTGLSESSMKESA